MSAEWKDSYYVEAYKLASEGRPDTEIAERLGVEMDTLHKWQEEKPEFKKALRAGWGIKSYDPDFRDMEGLTHRQRLFVSEFLVDLNAKEAAIRAGYRPRGAPSSAMRLLQYPQVRKAIAAAMTRRMGRLRIDADRVLQELEYIAFANPLEVFDEFGQLKDITEMDERVARSISGLEVTVNQVTGEVKTKIKFWDKLGALKLMAQHTRLIEVSKHLTLNDNRTVNVNGQDQELQDADGRTIIEAKRLLDRAKRQAHETGGGDSGEPEVSE